jgi:hypothetical protein
MAADRLIALVRAIDAGNLLLGPRSRVSAECLTRIACPGEHVLSKDELIEFCNRYVVPDDNKLKVVVSKGTQRCSCVFAKASKGTHQAPRGTVFVEGITIARKLKRASYTPYLLHQSWAEQEK